MLSKVRNSYEPPKVTEEGLRSDMLFADYLEQWLEVAKTRIAIATYSSYSNMVQSTIAPYFRKTKVKLCDLEASHIQTFYNEKLKVVKPNTVIHYHAVIHSALKYAVKTDMLSKNVADKVDRPKKNSFQPVFLSAEEMETLFRELKGSKLELPVMVAAFYGFRRGEVVGLKWDAIDFERGTISVSSWTGRRTQPKRNPVCGRCRWSVPSRTISCRSNRRRSTTSQFAVTATITSMTVMSLSMKWATA